MRTETGLQQMKWEFTVNTSTNIILLFNSLSNGQKAFVWDITDPNIFDQMSFD